MTPLNLNDPLNLNARLQKISYCSWSTFHLSIVAFVKTSRKQNQSSKCEIDCVLCIAEARSNMREISRVVTVLKYILVEVKTSNQKNEDENVGTPKQERNICSEEIHSISGYRGRQGRAPPPTDQKFPDLMYFVWKLEQNCILASPAHESRHTLPQVEFWTHLYIPS